MTSTAQVLSSRARLVTGLAFVLCFVNYLDRVVISFAITPIKAEFGLTNTSFGLCISLFALGALTINGLSGVLLDRWGVRIIWTIGLLVWTAAMAVLGLTNLWVLFLCMRFLLGVGEGVNFPAMNRAVADWVPPQRTGAVIGLMVLGVPAALLLGGPLLSHLIEWIDWHRAFIVLAIGSLAISVVLPIIYRNVPPSGHANKASVSWRALLGNPTLLATCWSFFAFGYVLWFGITWIPGYFQQTWGMELTTIGWFSTLPWGLAVVLIPIVGLWSDRRMARTGRVRAARVHPIWIFQLAGAMCFVPLIFLHDQSFAIVCIAAGVGLSMAANAPYYAICIDLFPRQAGAATGIMITSFSISGLVAPLLTGWLTDQFGGFDVAFIVLACLVASGALGMLCFARPDRVKVMAS